MNRYDDTKKMLNILRSLKNTQYRSINEQFETDQQLQKQDIKVSDKSTQDDITVINDVDVKILSTDEIDLELSEEHKNILSSIIDSFREQVSQISNLEPGITISEDQIRLDGSLPDEDINFVIIAGNESGLYINADMLKLEEDVLLMLQKLQKFELSFKDGLEPIIRERQNN